MSIQAMLKCGRSPGRPKVKSDEDQCRTILAATRKVFLAKGYDKMTMDDVAAKAGMSKKTLYRLFEGKQSLFIALIEEHRAEMIALPGNYDNLSLEEALALIFRIDIGSEDDIERMAVLKLIKTEAAKSPEVMAILKEHAGERSAVLLADWLERQVENKRIQLCDCRNAAQILLDMIFGAIIKKGGQLCEWPEHSERSAYMRQCIDLFVNGCASKENST